MTQMQINSLLKSFNISDDELEARAILQELTHSLSSIIVDDFAKNYLLNNSELSIYLAHTDADRLLKNIKEFVAFIMTAPVDENYIGRIHDIGSIHFSIKLEPAKVSYGFWAINEVLNKLAEINELVKENKSLISKLLRFVEHVMNNGYYIQREKLHKDSIDKMQASNVQNELYLAFGVHKQNTQKIESHFNKDTELATLEKIEERSQNCVFAKVLERLASESKFEYILGSNLDKVTSLHDDWHKEFVKYKHSSTTIDLQNSKAKITSLNNEIKNILDNTLQKSLDDGYIALNSGIKSMESMAKLFHTKENHNDFETMFHKSIEDTFSEFTWAIDDIYIDFDTKPNENYKIQKMLRHAAKNIYIGIRLKDTQNNDYNLEILAILLEILDVHLSSKERERSLISFADKAENANKSKDIFLANMSHELRTPLNAITGFSQILMKKKDTPDTVKKYVQKINIAGKNLLDLVNTILDFAKLEAGKMQFSPRLSDISSILNEATTLISPIAKNKEITLKMPKIISLNLFMDDKLFKQVLINLLTNAVKFTPNGGHVCLSIIYDADKHLYRFEVKDNGIGLSPESIKKLFKAFSQVENSYRKTEQGTGLGLMISKKIIEELHKGELWVESIEGEGSSFFINMPTPMIESHTYEINEAPKDSRAALVVEDSPSYQKILAEHLKETINLTFTDTINKAKDLLLKNHYDFLILDFFLTDGISSEILEFMEDENINIPAIIISAEDEIDISSSLSGSTNLEGIMNKNNIDEICDSIKGKVYHE